MTDVCNKLSERLDLNAEAILQKCDERKRRIDELEALLGERDKTIRQLEQTVEALNTRYTNLYGAKSLITDDTASVEFRKRLEKLVRDVDICIAAVNE